MMKKVIPGYIIAALFWFFMFSPWTKDLVNFWILMLGATGTLTVYSLINGKESLKEIYKFKFNWVLIGIIAAALLYLLFYAGNEISRLLFDFTDRQVNNIYSTKSQADKLLIGLALFLWIGPGEEIFWRGFAQHYAEKKFGPVGAWLFTALIYSLVHIWSFNFMLYMAALICGLFWGFMFMKFKNVWPGLISHALWDLFIFIIIPMQ